MKILTAAKVTGCEKGNDNVTATVEAGGKDRRSPSTA